MNEGLRRLLFLFRCAVLGLKWLSVALLVLIGTTLAFGNGEFHERLRATWQLTLFGLATFLVAWVADGFTRRSTKIAPQQRQQS
jgi:hypothetical protein